METDSEVDFGFFVHIGSETEASQVIAPRRYLAGDRLVPNESSTQSEPHRAGED